ncbi:MAG: chromosomal replication initiator protein DnaA [Acidimicrobiales bacterium]
MEGYTLVGKAQQLWTACTDAIRCRVGDAAWSSHFQSTAAITLTDDRLLVAVPSSLVKQRIETRWLELLTTVLADLASRPLTVALEVRPVRTDDDGESPTPGPDIAPRAAPPASTGSPRLSPGSSSGLNPRYTFDAFVIGASNRFAHAALLAVAETPLRSYNPYNPLFIYGGTGLGKTHLLHAVAHYVHDNYPDSNVCYVSTEAFMNAFVNALRTNTTTAFKARYRRNDVLLVDDIQFMEGKEGLQEEFFHTFNELHETNRKIVLSSDRPPRSIQTLEERLRSRFEWGLLTNIQPPDVETRLAILRKKAERGPTPIPEEALNFIATHITDNIRELEGALTRVTAFANLNAAPITEDLLREVLRDFVSEGPPRIITAALILTATSDMYGFSVEELVGRSRRRPLVTARQIAMYMCREMTDHSFPTIAREFGNRDHTTVMHAVTKISDLLRERRQLYEEVGQLRRMIRTGD